ncbi:hypothetical protein ACFOZ7_13505 [Natribaculum luteum]|uniref:Uncharacterized protein n=1 Tax=Natribaculum luteum TaxID=1586232 RepID=A0ABD5P0Y5_9EURY|nr:hypothetical protein [Natribaculum luteum]
MTPTPTSTDLIEVTDGDRTIELEMLRTPTGERLVVRSTSDETRVDALALESLTWQNDVFFEELTAIPHEDGEDTTEASDEIQISNEYTVVRLQTLETTAGPRVAIESPKLGYSCRLSPAELDAIAHEQIELFSDLLATPFGPETDHHHGIH